MEQLRFHRNREYGNLQGLQPELNDALCVRGNEHVHVTLFYSNSSHDPSPPKARRP